MSDFLPKENHQEDKYSMLTQQYQDNLETLLQKIKKLRRLWLVALLGCLLLPDTTGIRQMKSF